MQRASFGIAVAAFMLACGDGGPASLTISLDKLPDVTNAVSVTISGSLTRVPAKKTTYVVTITGGTKAIADTVDSAGHFAFSEKLSADSANSFTVSATDAQGSVSPSVTVSITQDDVPPDIAKITPGFAADLVPKSQTISFVLSEPAAAAYVTLLRQGVDQPGTLTMASDSVNGTFVPTAPLAPNSIYTFYLVGLKDHAGNKDTVGSCFLTGGASVVSMDTSLNHFTSGAPSTTLVRPILLEARWARDNALLTGVLHFKANRSLFLADPTNVSVYLDFDSDQNPATGVKSYRDTILTNLGPSVMSGIGAEYLVVMQAVDANGTGGGFAARYTNTLFFDPASAVTFVQDLCGPFLAFNVPFSAFGNDDGKMNYSVFAEADDATGRYADVMPTKGPLTFDISAAAGTAPIATSSSRTAPAVRPRALQRLPLFRMVPHP